MNTHNVGSRVAGLLVVSTFFGCFTTVDPLKTADQQKTSPALKPNLMLLIDNSGSMTEPIAGGGSRISALQAALSHVLTVEGASARYGLAVFPEANGPTQSIRVELPPPSTTDDNAALEAQAIAVNDAIQVLSPQGGTPTAASLAFVGTDVGLNAVDDRADYVVLITDGEPNLNAANPNAICDCGTTCAQARLDACACTQGSCENFGICSIGCLDRDATLASIDSLRTDHHITTFVVSYGDDVTSPRANTLMNSMAAAGGSGTTYPAGSQAELDAALLTIIARIAAESADAGN